MSSLDDKSTFDKSVDGGGKGVSVSASNKKECTSCEQKNDDDGSSNNTSGRSSNLSDIGALAEGISRVDIYNDNNAGISSTASNNIIFNWVESEAISDEKLFADPPPKEDCPICMLPMPHASGGVCGVRATYQPCCGKLLCEGCVLASVFEVVKGNLKDWCEFCRAPSVSDKKTIKRCEKRMKLNDPNAFHRLAYAYTNGEWGLRKVMKKAFKYYTRAAELGSSRSHYEIGVCYHFGEGVDKDTKRAFYHWELAAIDGHEMARHTLGANEGNNGNIGRAMKHFMIAAKSGHCDSLKMVGEGYKRGNVTKDEYATTLRASSIH